MQNFFLMQVVDPARLARIRQEIEQHGDLWLHDTGRQKLPEQAQTNTITLRSALRPPGHIGKSWHLQEVENNLIDHFPIVAELLYSFAASHGYQLSRAMIVRLQPWGEVLKHKDFGRYYDCRDRFHLVVESANGSVLTSGNEINLLRDGEVWWFNNSLPHQASNRSAHWRTHIIFDCFPAMRKPPQVVTATH